MEAHDVHALLGGLRELRITPNTTEEEAEAAMRPLASFNQCTLGLARFSGQRHGSVTPTVTSCCTFSREKSTSPC